MAEIEQQVARPRKPRAPRRRPKPAGDELPDSPDPLEIALKAVATGADRHGVAQALLEKHSCLIDIQCEREKEELAGLRVQRLTRWLILTAVAASLAGIAALLWVAAHSSSLVIEPFDVPPALAQRGLTGKVVSARVLDRLAELQRRTESMRGQKSYANDWQDDIKLDIPQTGVSVSEAWRTIKGWLGEETRIGGELVQTPAGIAITTRAGSLTGGTVTGPEADFDRLIGEAAASIYKVTQPYRYAMSLVRARSPQTEEVLLALTGDPSPTERKWAFSGLSAYYRGIGDTGRSLAMAREALAIDPRLLPAIGNVGLGEQALGHDEATLASFRAFDREFARASSDTYDLRIAGLNNTLFKATAGERLGDAGAMLAAAKASVEAGASSFSEASMATRATAAVLVHDFVTAERLRAALRNSEDPDSQLSIDAAGAQIALEHAVELRDPATVRAAAREYLQRAAAARAGYPNPIHRAEAIRRTAAPEAAISLARVGLARDAQALASTLPEDCYDCMRARGWAAAAGGDGDRALGWFRRAQAAAPSIPMAFADAGEILLRKGDVRAAEQAFARASEKGPKWVDAMVLRARALAMLGRDEEASALLARAAGIAPRWGELRMALGRALWRRGRHDEARSQFRLASTLELSAGDRAWLRRIWSVAFPGQKGPE